MTHEVMDRPQVELVGELPFGEGNIGVKFESPEERETFVEGVAANVVPLTKPNTGFCGDEREIIGFADGTEDPEEIESIVTHSIMGGLGLGATKICIAANLDFLKNAKTMQEAYELTVKWLVEAGYEDAAHEGCGASGSVEETTAKSVRPEVGAGIADLIVRNERVGAHFAAIHATKSRRLEEGLYGTWDKGWHSDFVASRFPQNFARLKTADDATKGHYGRGVVLQAKEGYGFKKNRFIRETGMQAFSETAEMLTKIADIFGKTPEEQWRIVFAGIYDLEDVGNVLFKQGMPAFKAA